GLRARRARGRRRRRRQVRGRRREHWAEVRAGQVRQARDGEPAARPQAVADVREGRYGVAEEHDAEPADGHVETAWREPVDLRVSLLEGHVADAFFRRPGAGP